MIWSPLGGGRIFKADSEKEGRIKESLQIVGKEIGAESIDEVAFAWLLSHPVGAVPITGSSNIQRVKKAVSALKYKLSREQWYRIWTASTGHSVP